MSTLFIIGNGFDLNCGLKTRYKDVYQSYITTESKTNAVEKFKKEIKDNIENWSDFEVEMANYASKLSDEASFIECITDFLEYLSGYLQNQENQFIDLISNSMVCDEALNEIKDSISNFYTGVSGNVDNLMSKRAASNYFGLEVISFNYTRIFDILFEKYGMSINPNNLKIVHHVHGDMEAPTLGMDNEFQIKTSFPVSVEFKRCFIKPFFNEVYDVSRMERANKLIDDSNTICVFGMSLGLSDLTWRKKLIEWLYSSSDNHLFLYDYEFSNMSVRTVQNRMTIEEKAKMKKLETWGVNDAGKVFEQFHIVCGKNIFNIAQAVIKAQERIEKVKVIKNAIDDN